MRVIHMDKNEIQVVRSYQLATIEDNIVSIVSQVKNEIQELNIGSMVVSEDNKQTLKNVRADLNKKLALFESERKKIKDFVMQPYADFETQYNSKLKPVFNEAIKELDDKIKFIEAGQKQELEDYAREYFNRKLEANPITMANKFENVGVNISLSTNKKRIREEIDFHFEKIESASYIIATHEHHSRLRAIFENDARYDIGVALTLLTKQLSVEKQYVKETDFGSMYPKAMTEKVVTKVPQVVEKMSQEIVGEVFDFKLSITVTEQQLALLTAFMEDQDIAFELYED